MLALKFAVVFLFAAVFAQSSTSGNAITTDLGGPVDGTFEYLGTLCFPASTTTKITISVKDYQNPTGQKDLRVLFYDDQPDSFDALMTKGQTCQQKVQMSKQLCSGSNNCVSGYRVGIDADPLPITITESVERQWYFIAADCQANTSIPVTLSYDITSPDAVPCSTIHQGASTAGYVVAIVFLVIFVAILATTTVIFYKKSQTPGMGAMPENYEQL